MPPATCMLIFDILTLTVVSESRVTWATCVPILVFLGLSVLDLGPMYATDRQIDVRRASSLNASYPRGGGIMNVVVVDVCGLMSVVVGRSACCYGRRSRSATCRTRAGLTSR